MNIEWWMIDGAVGLIFLIAALRGAVRGIGDTVIRILCIAGGIGLDADLDQSQALQPILRSDQGR